MAIKVRLWCILYPENSSHSMFVIRTKSNRTIAELKRKIKRHVAPTLDNVDARNLELWKCSIPVGDNLKPTLDSLQLDGTDDRLVFLNIATSTVEANFPELLEETLHLIVNVPDEDQRPSKRARLGAEAVDDPWLLELHGKIWNRKDLKRELFRTVKLTTAHYNKLEENIAKLKVAESDPQVLSAKLSVLQCSDIPSIAPAPVPEHLARPTNERIDGDNDVDNEIRSLFPFTLEYLDLSSLKLRTPTMRMPQQLLIREEYKALSTLLAGLPRDACGSAIISGQPGVGKTTYLYLRLVQCMIEGTPCLFQTKECRVYLVADTVKMVDSWSGTHILAFCDADGDWTSQPAPMILNSMAIQFIAACSPKGADEKWTNKLPGISYAMKYVIALWSPQELFLTGIFLFPWRHFLFSRLQESTSYLGFNPRRCFKASVNSASLEQERGRTLQMIHEIHRVQSLLEVFRDTRSNQTISHAIFQLSPRDDMRYLHQAEVAAVSPWALHSLLKAYEEKQKDASYQFYQSIANHPDAGTLRGQMFERQALNYLSLLGRSERFTIRCLADSTTSEWVYPDSTECSQFQSSTVVKLLEDAVNSKKALHLIPQSRNFPAVDSILYNPGEVLTGIQVTASMEHPVAVIGLKRIQGWLKEKPLSDLRPKTMGHHWKLIFVVPSGNAEKFQKQSFRDDTATGEWSKKVDQYVLGLDENTIWGRTVGGSNVTL